MKQLSRISLAVVLGFSLVVTTLAVAAENPPTFLSKWGSSGTEDGQFKNPYGVAVDSTGNVYVADYVNHRIQKFASGGTFLAKWGSLGTGDGQFNFPTDVATDSFGNVYVSDVHNNTIQKFNSDGTFLAKWGSSGTGDGQFNGPKGVAVDSAGNVYVADSGNQRVQKFSSGGTLLAKWGSRGTLDGQFNGPYGVAVDSAGNVYVADNGNNCIQKFNSDGTFLAKWGSPGTGDGQFNGPKGVAVDSHGDVYVADHVNHRIQKFTSSGTLLAKWGGRGTLDGQFNLPTDVATDSLGNVYVSDTLNNRIQKFGYAPPQQDPVSDTQPPITTASLNPAPNANGWNNTDVTVKLTATDNSSGVKEVHYTLSGSAPTTVSGTLSFSVKSEGDSTVTYFAKDNAGNAEAARSLVIKIDKTPPTITGSRTIGPNSNGWNNGDVTVRFTATDNLSGVASVSPDVTISTEGAGQSATGSATDKAGNTSSVTISNINIDKTKPAITINSPQARDYLTSDSITLDFSATDATSGVGSLAATLDSIPVTNGQVISLSSIAGNHTLAVSATDRAGNSDNRMVGFSVVIAATVDIDPDTLNLKSQSDKNAVTAHISLTSGYDVAQINVATVKLNVGGTLIAAQLTPTSVGEAKRMVKFDRQAVIAALAGRTDDITLVVSGELNGGSPFTAADTIKVINPGKPGNLR